VKPKLQKIYIMYKKEARMVLIDEKNWNKNPDPCPFKSISQQLLAKTRKFLPIFLEAVFLYFLLLKIEGTEENVENFSGFFSQHRSIEQPYILPVPVSCYNPLMFHSKWAARGWG
jgi:hypothetical protein